MLDHVTRLLHGVQDVLGGVAPARQPGFRVLVAASGGPHAKAVIETLPGLAGPGYELQVVHVRAPGSTSGVASIEDALGRLRLASTLARGREIVSQDVRGALVGASRDADLLVLGASLGPRPASNALTVELAKRSACPVILIRAGEGPQPPRSRRRALVVGESSLAGRLGLNRALRWGLTGGAQLDILLGQSDDPFARLEADPGPLDPDPAYASVRALDETIDARRVLDELENGKQDILVLAVDPLRLDGGRRWVDEVIVKSKKPVVVALAGRKGPRTRTKVPMLAAV